MRRIQRIFLFALLTLFASGVFAGGVDLVIQARGRTPLDPAPGAGRIVFTDEPVVLNLSLHYIADGSAHSKRDPNRVFEFSTRDWFDAVELHLRNRQDGTSVPVVPRVLRRGFAHAASYDIPRNGKVFVLRDGEGVNADIELLGLTPGDYVLEGRLGAESSQPDDRGFFSIRRGDEDLATTRLFYRYRADKVSNDFRKYEAILRELMAKYEPANAGILVEIADWSIDKVPPEETVRLYREARTLLEANWRAELTKNPNVPETAKKGMEEAIEQLTVFERVLPYYREHRNELRIGRTSVGGKAVYAWFPRQGGLMVDTIDPANPGRRIGTRQR